MRQILFIQQLNGKRKKLRSCASFFPWQHSYLSSSKFVPIWFYIPNFPFFNSDPHGTASSTSSGESAPSTTLASTSSSSFTSSPSSVPLQQPDLGAFSRESICSWPWLCANPGKTAGQNHQWRLRWAYRASYLFGWYTTRCPCQKRVVEITDILTWIQAFTIYQWIFCSTYPSRWQDTTQYKLLILQMACQFPRPAWLNYDMAFRKDAAAYFVTDWSQVNLNLYNFHSRASSTITGQSAPRPTSLPYTSASSNIKPKRSFNPIQYCQSWNDGACHWSPGECRYRRVCKRCDGEHPLTNCPFRANKGSQRSWCLTPSVGKRCWC